MTQKCSSVLPQTTTGRTRILAMPQDGLLTLHSTSSSQPVINCLKLLAQTLAAWLTEPAFKCIRHFDRYPGLNKDQADSCLQKHS
jgi:hypothetical protein